MGYIAPLGTLAFTAMLFFYFGYTSGKRLRDEAYWDGYAVGSSDTEKVFKNAMKNVESN